MDINSYITSDDYELLFELMQTKIIICLIHNKSSVTTTYFSNQETHPFSSSDVWGIKDEVEFWIKVTNKENFVEYCKSLKLSFLPPNLVG